MGAYFHYHPSYYHLHVHFQALDYSLSSATGSVLCVPLTDVIQNIKLVPDYYQRVDITVTLAQDKPLAKALLSATQQ